MIKVISTRHLHSQTFTTIGGAGGYGYRPETTVVEWSDGTRLVVEDSSATAFYHQKVYKLDRISSTLHENIVDHWTRAISIRLQRDVGPTNRLAERVRNWRTDWPEEVA